MVRGGHGEKDETEEGEKEEKEREERDESGEESRHAAAATAATANERGDLEDTEVDTVLPSTSPRTICLAYAISSGTRITDKSSYAQGGGGIGRCGTAASSGIEKSWDYDHLQQVLFESKWMEGLPEKEEEEREEDRGGGVGGGGGGGRREMGGQD
eukprot:evm.model.NODE_18005_length_18873_cov_30.856833.3